MVAALAHDVVETSDCLSAESRSHVPQIPSLRLVTSNPGTQAPALDLDGRDLPALGEESVLTISASFPAGDPMHVHQVRSWLGSVLIERWGPDDGLLGELAAGEVIANAGIHGAGTVRVVVAIRSGEFVADVSDDSEALPKRRFATSDEVSGRGLEIVDRLGGELAILRGGVGKTVRLRMPRKQPDLAGLLAVWGDDDV